MHHYLNKSSPFRLQTLLRIPSFRNFALALTHCGKNTVCAHVWCLPSVLPLTEHFQFLICNFSSSFFSHQLFTLFPLHTAHPCLLCPSYHRPAWMQPWLYFPCWKEVKLQDQVTFICASCCCCCCCCSRRKASCCCCLCLMISFWRWSSSSLRFRSSSSSRCRAASSSMRSRLSSSRRWASSSSRAHLAASSSFPGHRKE